MELFIVKDKHREMVGITIYNRFYLSFKLENEKDMDMKAWEKEKGKGSTNHEGNVEPNVFRRHQCL